MTYSMTSKSRHSPQRSCTVCKVKGEVARHPAVAVLELGDSIDLAVAGIR